MAKELIFLVEEASEGGFEAHAIGHPIFTQADSYEELKKMARDAVRCHFEENEMPQIIRMHFVRDEVIPA